MDPAAFALFVAGLVLGVWIALEAYSRGWGDLFLYWVRCFGVLHRPARRELGPYAKLYGDDMVCTRCGATWMSQ